MLKSAEGEDTLTIRFVTGVTVDETQYGPCHRDEPVTLPADQARHYLGLGVARLVESLLELPVDPPAPETAPTAKARPARKSRTRRTPKKG
jgi:hypothetical protein